MALNRDTARRALAALLLAHALGHALPGMRVLDTVSGATGLVPAPLIPLALVTAIFALTLSGLLAGGLGMLGVRPFDAVPRHLIAAGLTASTLLLVGLKPASAWIGLGFNAGFALALFRLDMIPERAAPTARGASRRIRWHDAVAIGFVSYVAVVALLRPWHQRWGSTEKELRAPLPGDQYRPGEAQYGIQHAVTIDAPPHAIWPWLAQLGQDRAGFYSYGFVENLAGLGVHNADRIHPEWQDIETRRFVQAMPPGWLGRSEPLGWRVPLAEPNQVLVLERWGAFVLLPVGENTTRFIIRTRGVGPMNGSRLALAPISLLLFEPIHFIMERRMMLGVKARAEATSPAAPTAASRAADSIPR